MSTYRQACIPEELALEICRINREHPELGYRTLSEFVRTAAIAQLRQVHTQLSLNAVWATAELGADAIHALLRDSLPGDYQAIFHESTEARRGTVSARSDRPPRPTPDSDRRHRATASR